MGGRKKTESVADRGITCHSKKTKNKKCKIVIRACAGAGMKEPGTDPRNRQKVRIKIAPRHRRTELATKNFLKATGGRKILGTGLRQKCAGAHRA